MKEGRGGREGLEGRDGEGGTGRETEGGEEAEEVEEAEGRAACPKRGCRDRGGVPKQPGGGEEGGGVGRGGEGGGEGKDLQWKTTGASRNLPLYPSPQNARTTRSMPSACVLQISKRTEVRSSERKSQREHQRVLFT